VPRPSHDDPIPLSRQQLAALVPAVARELAWGLRGVSHEIRGWRARASSIVNPAARRSALASLAEKRGHIDGAALFWILARRRDLRLLQLLVAYNVLCDYLDSLTEEAATERSVRLHRALTDALDPWTPVLDHGALMQDSDDGGYLLALVERCRAGCASLPSFIQVQPLVLVEAGRAQAVLPLNHISDPAVRDLSLRRWAAHTFPLERELLWFELTAAASTWLSVQALLALAATPECQEREAAATSAAYFPWCSLAGTMLDSYVDQSDDAANGDHSYIAHYPSREVAVDRVRESIRQSAGTLLDLRNGHRHALIFACMIAMYLSKDSAREPDLRESTHSLAQAGGTLTRLLLPILRTWRIAYAQRAA
jgi:tetraprenyl-beta-curcumene synthase